MSSPLASALQQQDWPDRAKCRWLLAYWCFASAGLASWLAGFGDRDFAKMLQRVASRKLKCPVTTGWPQRAGLDATTIIQELVDSYGDRPEDAVYSIFRHAPSYVSMAQWARNAGFQGPLETLAIEMVDDVFRLSVEYPIWREPAPARTVKELRKDLSVWIRLSPYARQLDAMFEENVNG